MVGHIKLLMELEYPAAILNLSPGGMLVATAGALNVGDEFKFRFNLPDRAMVAGRGRVVRAAPPTASASSSSTSMAKEKPLCWTLWPRLGSADA